MSHMVGISTLAEWERVEAALPPLATADNDGLMTKEDKGELQKLLDRLEALGGSGSNLGIFDCTHLVTFDRMTYISDVSEESSSSVLFKSIDFLENYSYLLYIAFDQEHNFMFGARYDIDVDALYELGERQYIEYETDIEDDDEDTVFNLAVRLCAPLYTVFDNDEFESYHSYATAGARDSYITVYQLAVKEL